MSNQKDKCIALSALFMATEQIDQIAYKGSYNQHDATTLIKSLFYNETGTAEDVYGGIESLKNGLERTVSMLSNAAANDSMEIMRYAISLIHLETQLAKNEKMGDQLIIEVANIERTLLKDTQVLDPDLLEQLGALYQSTISGLGPRIMIKGEQEHLEDEATVAKVRSLLLAGIRAAVLWKQSGGNRFTLLLNRKALIAEAEELLRAC